ncbi:MAG TPA: hypothetical protein VNX21_04500, partial [Candidatus Thermoplasmatota archaeon]|nr:hypothetical protein [Candidatus Thermoplasmatota archaeon]
RDERPVAGPGYLLDLPRLGVGIGDASDTRHERDYALLVDIGGRDTYVNHAGASTPLFPTALALDHGADPDVYRLNATTNLSAFAPFSRASGRGYVAGSTVEGPGPEVGDAPDAALGVAQGAGVFGIGVLVDGGEDNRFDVNLTLALCDTCDTRAVALGVAQGAGLVGVGILDLRPSALGYPSDLRVTVFANSTNPRAAEPAAIARAFAQGAGVFGVGILASEHPTAGDTYALNASVETVGRAARAASAGQGYSLRGLGVLLDAGGNNVLKAETLAQGAADDDHLSTPVPRVLSHTGAGGPDHFSTRARGTAAMLLLPGVGNDRLMATSASQAYAGAAGTAILFDAEGDDVRSLSSADLAFGQAAATVGGAAFLVDNRGDDTYHAAGFGVQAYGQGGLAVLVDVSGSDAYHAAGRAQATVRVWNTELASAQNQRPTGPLPGTALFVDRMGYDRYVIPHDAIAQGGVVQPTIRVLASPPTFAPSAAIFVDAGGTDEYQGRAWNQTGKRTADGNGGDRWTTNPHPYLGTGVDNEAITAAFASVADRLAATGTGARMTAHNATTDALWDAPTLNGTVLLRASLAVNGQANPAAGSSFDRAEFLFENRSLGRGAAGGGKFDFRWTTAERDALGRPLYPDGVREVQARVYPRVGTPVAGDAAASRRAAVDAEPLPARLTVSIDNAPLAQLPA